MFANWQVATLFGYTQTEVIGPDIDLLLPKRLRAQHVGHRRGYTEHARLRPMSIGLDLPARRKAGSEFPVEISLSPIGGGGEMLVAAAIRDVTSAVWSRMSSSAHVKRSIAL